MRLAATLEAAERLENDREAALKQWRLDVERAAQVVAKPATPQISARCETL